MRLQRFDRWRHSLSRMTCSTRQCLFLPRLHFGRFVSNAAIFFFGGSS